jgi:hypothetical protein
MLNKVLLAVIALGLWAKCSDYGYQASTRR